MALCYWWRLGMPVPMADAPSDHLACVSYSPYRMSGQAPWDKDLVIPLEQIEEDLRALSHSFECVRTYSVAGGLAAVPAAARRVGMEVLLGLWIGRDATDNEREIAQGIALARNHADTVRAVIVGNEVLLRRELPAETLRGVIERVRQSVPQPVTYADVWEFWLKNPKLASATSFITVHILPYWEDRPVPVERAVAHVVEVFGQVRAAFPGREILIGETGWPSVGRDRGGATPSRVNQARFIREFSAAAQDHRLPYNVVEAFDQPWKRRLEGAAGGYWGLLDAAGEAKFPFRGPVLEEMHWRWGLGASAATGIVFLLAGAFSRQALSPWGAAILLFAGTATGGALAAQVRTMLLTNRTPGEWAVSLTYSLLALAAAWLVGRSLAASASGQKEVLAPLARIVRGVRSADNPLGGAEMGLSVLRFAFLFGAATTCLLLVFDARYRDFPLELFAVPVLGFFLLAVAGDGVAPPSQDDDIEERLLAAAIALAAPLIVCNEGLANHHALAWAGLCWMLAAAVALARRGGRASNEHQQAEKQSHR
jgi:glucan 1,3-beta-glucosidase